MTANLVPFGKYKGQPVERLLEDKDYAEWLMAQDWFKNRFGPLYTVVINHGQEPVDTPEHNALQAKFLDFDFRAAFAPATAWEKDASESVSTDATSNWNKLTTAWNLHNKLAATCQEDWCSNYRKRIGEEIKYQSKCHECWNPFRDCYLPHSTLLPPTPEPPECRSWVGEPTFETAFIDVIYEIGAYAVWAEEGDRQYRASLSTTLKIEIKPAIGDDYPAVLRQCHKRGSTHVLGARYTGIGVPKDQVTQMFTASGFDRIWLDAFEDPD
jgi:uncharacterized protein (DUF3820 family)